MLLPFVFVSLEGSSVKVGDWDEEASSEQRIGRSLKKKKDTGELLWNVRHCSGDALRRCEML